MPRSAFTCMIVTLAVCLGSALPAHAEKRLALVIGNSAYRHVPALANPANDASDMAAALGRLGFSVTRVENAGFDALRRALLAFGRQSRGAEMAVVYFAGHGMEVGGENYLIAVDAELRSDIDADNEAIALKSVMLTVAGASRLGLVILDACRNNPFSGRMQRTVRTRSVDRGLARVEPTGSVLVAYAARDGTAAADGDGRNSPFTAALLRHIETPALEINFLFRRVRDDVLAATRRSQEPYTYGALSGEPIYLNAAFSTPTVGPLVPPPAPPARPVSVIAPAIAPGIASPKEPLPDYMPIDPEVLRLVETHPFFANAPPVRIGSYEITLASYSTTKGGGISNWMRSHHNQSYDIRWLRSGLIQQDETNRYTVNNSGAVGNYNTQSTTISAANGLLSLSYRTTFGVAGRNQKTTSQLVRLQDLKGSIFPVEVGRKFSYEAVFRMRSTGVHSSSSVTTTRSSCEVTKAFEGHALHRELTGKAYLLRCHETVQEKGKAPTSAESLDLFVEAWGIWQKADPVSPPERIFMNNERSVHGAYTSLTNGTYTLKSFMLAR